MELWTVRPDTGPGIPQYVAAGFSRYIHKRVCTIGIVFMTCSHHAVMTRHSGVRHTMVYTMLVE